MTVSATVALGVGVALLPSTAQAAAACTGASTVRCTFAPTGAEQTFTVPAGVDHLDVLAVGAAGGPGAAVEAGIGAEVTGTLTGLTAGEVLYVEVGGVGTTGGGGFNGGGFNGGGATHDSTAHAGSGGGASDVRTEPATVAGSLGTRLVVAGAGGGGGGDLASGNGGDGGPAGRPGLAGQPSASGGVSAQPGEAGTTSAGGGGGQGLLGASGSDDDGAAGALGTGGDGSSNGGAETSGGGGGGGGVYGGGGGGGAGLDAGDATGAGGGGGSSLVPGGGDSDVSFDPAQVVLSYSSGAPAASLREAPYAALLPLLGVPVGVLVVRRRRRSETEPAHDGSNDVGAPRGHLAGGHRDAAA